MKVAICSFVALIGASMAHGSIVSVDPTSESYFWWDNRHPEDPNWNIPLSHERIASQLGGHGWTIEGRDDRGKELKTVTMTDFTDTGFSLSAHTTPNNTTSRVHYKFSVSQNMQIDIYLNSNSDLNANYERIFTFGVLGQAVDFRPTIYDFSNGWNTGHYTSTLIAGTTYEFCQNYIRTTGQEAGFDVVLTDPAAPVPTPGVIALIGIVGLVGSRRRKD